MRMQFNALYDYTQPEDISLTYLEAMENEISRIAMC